MDFVELLSGTVLQGLIYALVSFGVYITYSILDFPDLGVDGTFPLGAAVTAVLLTQGVNAWATLPIALVVARPQSSAGRDHHYGRSIFCGTE